MMKQSLDNITDWCRANPRSYVMLYEKRTADFKVYNDNHHIAATCPTQSATMPIPTVARLITNESFFYSDITEFSR